MQKRQLLTSVVIMLIVVVIIGYFVPFIASLGSNKKNVVEVQFPTLIEGQPIILDIGGNPLIVLKPSKEQWSDIRFLDSYVTNKKYKSFNKEIGVFAYWGISTRREVCDLTVKPHANSPLRDTKDAQWFGGYWDPVCEVSYDYAGRSINTYRYSYNGFVGDYPNLEIPSVFEKRGNNLIVSRYSIKLTRIAK